MKKISTLLLLLLAHFCIAQNLVPNSSFEDTVSCPNNYAEIDRAIGWSSYGGSPDYFNSCNNTYVGVPENAEGFQYARTGNAYAGFVSFAHYANTAREYLGIQLNKSMEMGHEYFVNFYVSLAIGAIQKTDIATNKLGIRFSTIPFSEVNPTPTNNFAHIYSDSVITDTLNWTRISGTFKADSAYQFLCIGNFFTDSATTHILFDSTAAFAYYYVDDVSVIDSLSDGINEKYSFNIVKIFPNPARDWIAIRGNDIQSLSLHDVLGRIVYSSNSAVISPAIINTSSFPRGIYFLEVKTKSENENEKIVLQ